MLEDALNARTPQIYDTIREGNTEKRVLNTEATEAAKEKWQRSRLTFEPWVWTDPDRTDRLARIYNDTFNNLVPRHSTARISNLAGARRLHPLLRGTRSGRSGASSPPARTYVAHPVGAGKTFSIAAAIMEQRRLGLIYKAMLVVPGHCLAQASREFLLLYPNARILVADETNFSRTSATAFWRARRPQLGRDHHHPFGVQVDPRPGGVRAAAARGRNRGLRRAARPIDSDDRLPASASSA